MEEKKQETLQETLTPVEVERKKLRFCLGQYRIAVRWLRDAKMYRQDHASDLTYGGKSWKPNEEGSLAEDAARAWKEAVAGVLTWRRRIDACNERLMDLASSGER